MITALAILCGLFPQAEPTVGLVEINHYQPCGEYRFTQIIAWEWIPECRAYHVQDWKMVEDWYVDERARRLHFRDGGKERSVRYKLYRETWTQNDPERDDRELFAEKYRIRVFR